MLSESSLIRQQLTADNAPKLKEGVAVFLGALPPDPHTRLVVAHIPDVVYQVLQGKFDQHHWSTPNCELFTICFLVAYCLVASRSEFLFCPILRSKTDKQRLIKRGTTLDRRACW